MGNQSYVQSWTSERAKYIVAPVLEFALAIVCLLWDRKGGCARLKAFEKEREGEGERQATQPRNRADRG